MSFPIKASKYEPNAPNEPISGVSLLLELDGRKGYVFMLARTKKSNGDSEFLLQTLNDHVHRLATTFGKEANAQHRFEQFLGALNETLAQHVREGKFRVPIEHFDGVVGIAVDQQMYLSGTGELTALFLHKKPSDRYQIFNLFRSIQTERAFPTWEKPFAVVLDGDLHEGDVFCIADKDLQRTIAQDELNNVLSSLPPKSATEKIRQYFPHNESLLLVIVKVQTVAIEQNGNVAKPLADVSVESLVHSKEETEKLLEDQKPKLGVLFINLVKKVGLMRKRRSQVLQDINRGNSGLQTFLRVLKAILRVLLRFVWRHGKTLFRFAAALSKKEKRAGALKKLNTKEQGVGKFWGNFLHRFKRLEKSSKYITIGAVLAVVVLMVSISILSNSQARAKNAEVYQEQISSIEDLIERADGAVIYKDENQARLLYVNAATVLESLAKDTEEQQKVAQDFETKIQTALDELRHIITIPNPPLLADLENITDGVFGNAMVQPNGQIYVFGSDGRVYQLDRTQKVFKPLGTTLENLLPASEASEEDGKIFFLDDRVGVSMFNQETEKQTVSSLTSKVPPWVDLVAYSNRIYLLLPETPQSDGQIERYTNVGSGFSDKTGWITSKTKDLKNVVSLAIDGSVYVLKKNGEVMRFDNGTEVGWETKLVDPPITEATDIWTDPESEFLYVLEPKTNRLIIYKKDSGEFIVQYRSKAFEDMTDIIIDESNYSIYLLAGSKLYSIAASHLE